MKTNKSIYAAKVLACAFLAATMPFQACQEESYSLGNIPNADFEVKAGADANTVILVNKTPGTSIAFWEATGQEGKGDEVSMRFTFQGSYDVTLTAATPGGIATVTKSITISENDPTACNPDKALGFIAGCTERLWKLNPEAGAFKVGPGPDNGSWWGSGTADVATRACEFNDEFTFTFDAAGTFKYDNKGDFFADGYLGNQTSGCEPAGNLSGTQAAWNSGNFRFSVTETGGVRGLGQLRLSGQGAHIGVKKAFNGGENTDGPSWNSITYDILEMTQNAGGGAYDILKIGVHIGGEGWWTFTLRSTN